MQYSVNQYGELLHMAMILINLEFKTRNDNILYHKAKSKRNFVLLGASVEM